MLEFMPRYYQFRTLEEAQALTNALASQYPEPSQARFGLMEIFINAIEHGNLGIHNKLKTELRRCGQWLAEISHRLNQPEHREKVVRVRFERCPHEINLWVKDQGQGFNWHNYLHSSYINTTTPNGRGLSLAKQMCFHRMEYVGCGNEVCCSVRLPSNQGSRPTRGTTQHQPLIT